MSRFEDLDVEEQRNEILKGIHNHLAQINKWLEVIAARYVKLRADDVEELRFDAENIPFGVDEISYGGFSNVGYTQARGMYKSFQNGEKEICEPLGEYERTEPIDEKTGFFVKKIKEDKDE